jgi:hypothetical protein
MAQYIVHPSEAGASAADRYGMGKLQALDAQTSNFVNNAAMQLRQVQQQKAQADRDRAMLAIGINPAGGALPYTAIGRTEDYLPQPQQDLAMTQMGLLGQNLQGQRFGPNLIPGWSVMANWPGMRAGSVIPFGATGYTMPSAEDTIKMR